MNRNRKLNNGAFKANQWLAPTAKEPGQSFLEGPSVFSELLPELPINDHNFHPSSFCIPGWHGEGLISKSALHTRRLINELEQDASEQFHTAASFAQARKQQIFEEFLSYSAEFNLKCHELENFVSFWAHLTNPESIHRKTLDQFSKSFCFRSAVVYLNKVRFIVSLTKALDLPLTQKDLGNFNHFLTRIFVHGSSHELQCDSLRPNQYSWYRPSQKHLQDIFEQRNNLVALSVTELNKIFTQTAIDDSLNFKDRDYSHSLSHRAFGLFLNELIVKLPQWLGEDKKKKALKCFEQTPTLLTTKYAGQYLGSLSASHWMAQEHNVHQNWRELICPDFYDDSYSHGQFLKICHELQFLSFLLHVAKYQGHEPLSLICRVIKEKYSAVAQRYEQMPLWTTPETTSGVSYQRIVINLTEFPKTNPHHFLLNHITQEARHLNRQGYLYVFSHQKLFVPSHSEKVEQLLKGLKLEAHFSFEGLKGKGEIPNYLYIFTKRTLETIENTFMPSFNLSTKESCLTFRWSGELTRFNKFNQVVEELGVFLKLKSANSTPVYQKETADGLIFDFHQDALFEGKLLSSHSAKSSTHITHPSFFKNLTKACLHLEHFFQIETISDQDQNHMASDRASALLGIPFTHQEKYPLVLIVDLTQSSNIRLEFIPYDTYQVKREQYGHVYYHYYGLTPKRRDIDINTFKEFYESRIGVQIIQLCLSGGPAKLKSKLRSLLVPKFFTRCVSIETKDMDRLGFLNLTTQELLTTHPTQIKHLSKLTFNECLGLDDAYAWHLLSLLSSFKTQVFNALNEINEHDHTKGRTASWNYTNPLIIEPLLKLKGHKIYTNNDDIYLDFLISDPQQFNLNLTEIKLKNDADNHYLELYHEETPILKLYADIILLDFLKFIFSSALGMPISGLIQNCTVPRTSELKEVLDNFTQIKGQLEDLYDQGHGLIADLLQKQISKNSSLT